MSEIFWDAAMAAVVLVGGAMLADWLLMQLLRDNFDNEDNDNE